MARRNTTDRAAKKRQRSPAQRERSPAQRAENNAPEPDDPKAEPHYSGERYGRADEGEYGGEGWEASQPDEDPDKEEAESLHPQGTGKPKKGIPAPRRPGRS